MVPTGRRRRTNAKDRAGPQHTKALRSMGKSRKATSDQTRIFRALEFVGLGYKDYIGARTLLIDHLPLQGATLGSSAVEKYIKALLSLRGE